MKQKKVGVVIGASGDAIHTIQVAKKKGIYVIGIDGDADAEGLKYVDERIHVDISDIHAVEDTIRNIKPDFIIPIPIGRYLLTTGYMNEKFNLKGIKYEATNLSTDKYLFHKKLHEAGLRNIKLYLLQPDKENICKDYDIPFPAIIKPRYGSGSRDVYYLQNKNDMKNALDLIKDIEEDFVLEQAVQGEEYSIDGAVINGELHITLLRKKIITPLPIRQPISSFSVLKDNQNLELYQRVYDYIEKVTQTLKYNNCLLNADLIINDHEAFTIEIAPRPSGHNLHNVFVPESTGIDIAEQYINFLLDEEFHFTSERIRRLQIRFFDFEDVIITKIPDIDFLKSNEACHIVRWECNIREGDYLNKVVNGHSIMSRGFFIVEGNDENDLISQSDWILNQFK